jgi:hypothetical protein
MSEFDASGWSKARFCWDCLSLFASRPVSPAADWQVPPTHARVPEQSSVVRHPVLGSGRHATKEHPTNTIARMERIMESFLKAGWNHQR